MGAKKKIVLKIEVISLRERYAQNKRNKHNNVKGYCLWGWTLISSLAMNAVSVNCDILRRIWAIHSYRLHNCPLLPLSDWPYANDDSSAVSLWSSNAFWRAHDAVVVASKMVLALSTDAFPLAKRLWPRPRDYNTFIDDLLFCLFFFYNCECYLQRLAAWVSVIKIYI